MADGTEFYEEIERLHWLLHRRRMAELARSGPFADTSRGQGRVVALLKVKPEISTKELAYLLGIRQQSLNELLNRLEKGGYAERVPSESDRRVMLVRLTEKGRAVPQEEAGRSGCFSCLNERELRAFGEFLERVTAALEEEVGITREDMDERFGWLRGFRNGERSERLMQLFGRRPHRRK
ncbi:MAG: MarR family transcriptional regulator [Treponemataceae bacterium]|nr:MarR family transcriptional regulator [Treponemataceae bacterium]